MSSRTATIRKRNAMAPESFTIDAEKLAVAMARKGLNGAQLSRACGFSAPTLSRIKCGHFPPLRRTVQKMAEVLGIDWRDLLAGESVAQKDLSEREQRWVAQFRHQMLQAAFNGGPQTVTVMPREAGNMVGHPKQKLIKILNHFWIISFHNQPFLFFLCWGRCPQTPNC